MVNQEAIPSLRGRPFRWQGRAKGLQAGLTVGGGRKKAAEHLEQADFGAFRHFLVVFQGIGHAAEQIRQQDLAAQAHGKDLDIEGEGAGGFPEHERGEFPGILDTVFGHGLFPGRLGAPVAGRL